MDKFQLNKPSEVTDENINSIVNDIYDAINRLSNLVAQEPEKSSKPKPKPSGSTKTIEDTADGSIKFGVNFNGEWYYTSALVKGEQYGI